VRLGNWDRAQSYAHDIISDLNHWTSAWIEWNLALSMSGGPNWAKNFADAPIIVNTTGHEYYKQPMYYALGHFTKFLPPGSRRINARWNKSNKGWRHWSSDEHLEGTMFSTPNNATVFILTNDGDSQRRLNIIDPRITGSLLTSLPPNSIKTYIWWPSSQN